MLGHETNLIKFRITEIMSSIFSDHDNMKIEINYKEKSEKSDHMETKQHVTKLSGGQK